MGGPERQPRRALPWAGRAAILAVVAALLAIAFWPKHGAERVAAKADAVAPGCMRWETEQVRPPAWAAGATRADSLTCVDVGPVLLYVHFRSRRAAERAVDLHRRQPRRGEARGRHCVFATALVVGDLDTRGETRKLCDHLGGELRR